MAKETLISLRADRSRLQLENDGLRQTVENYRKSVADLELNGSQETRVARAMQRQAESDKLEALKTVEDLREKVLKLREASARLEGMIAGFERAGLIPKAEPVVSRETYPPIGPNIFGNRS